MYTLQDQTNCGYVFQLKLFTNVCTLFIYDTGSRHSKPSSLSSFAGSSKLVRRLNRSSKKQQLNIGDQVSFLYNGKTQLGIARFTGSTNFSAGKWCGIELFENSGKHNGTVKGYQYFICKQGHGIFIPLQKVTAVLPNQISDDMKITIKSIKTPRKSKSSIDNTSDELSLPRNGLSQSSDSGIESPSHHINAGRPKQPTPISNSRRKDSKRENIVISSFVTPSPKKAVILNHENENENDKEIFCKHSDYNYLSKLSPKGNFTGHIVSSEMKNDVDKKTDMEEEGEHNENDDVFSEGVNITQRLSSPDDGTSKIPRRVTSFKVKDSEKTEPHESPPLVFPRRKISLKDNSVTSAPLISRSTKNSTFDGGKIEETYEQNKVYTPSWTRKKNSLKGKQHVDRKENGIKRGGSHDEPAFIMGNNNATQRGSLRKQNTIGCEVDLRNNQNTDEIYSQHEVQGAIVIDRKGKENKAKPKSSVKTNGFITDAKFKSYKDLQKEIDDLRNQLNERTNRIAELEVTLKNNTNKKEEEKIQYENAQELMRNEVTDKNKNIVELKERIFCADSLLETSNNGVQALAVVIQYYLTQVEEATEKLRNVKKEKTDITRHRDGLLTEQNESEAQITDLTSSLDAAKCRCEEAVKELHSLKLNHDVQITELQNKHEKQETDIRTTLEKQNDVQVKNLLAKYEEELEKLKVAHESELLQLNSHHGDALQEVKKEKDDATSNLQKRHEQELKEQNVKHEKDVEIIQADHAQQCDTLQKKNNTLESDKTDLSKRLEEVVKEVASDAKVQAALAQYKHLPAELESLQVVVDMKNSELKTLRVKCMELEKKVEDFYELQTKCDVLTQENQSLAEVLKKRVKAERQISVERDSLIEKFEQESRKVSRLSMEKEQLIWRASNPDLRFSGSSPNVFNEEDEGDSPPSPLLKSGSLSTTKQMSKKMKRRSMNFPLSQNDYDLR